MFFLFASTPPPMPCNIHPVYSLVPVTGKINVVNSGGKYQATASVTFRVHEVTGAVIVSVEPGLLDHVRGHQIIAERVARSSTDHVDANGATVKQARSRLTKAIHDLSADENSELTREERAYDNVTQNGAEQSQGPSYGLPGGPDVQDAACTRQ